MNIQHNRRQWLLLRGTKMCAKQEYTNKIKGNGPISKSDITCAVKQLFCCLHSHFELHNMVGVLQCSVTRKQMRAPLPKNVLLWSGQAVRFLKNKATDCLTVGEQGHKVPSDKENMTSPRRCWEGEWMIVVLCSVCRHRNDFNGVDMGAVKKEWVLHLKTSLEAA